MQLYGFQPAGIHSPHVHVQPEPSGASAQTLVQDVGAVLPGSAGWRSNPLMSPTGGAIGARGGRTGPQPGPEPLTQVGFSSPASTPTVRASSGADEQAATPMATRPTIDEHARDEAFIAFPFAPAFPGVGDVHRKLRACCDPRNTLSFVPPEHARAHCCTARARVPPSPVRVSESEQPSSDRSDAIPIGSGARMPGALAA